MSERFRALDLFCGAGGASTGLYRAGFDVTGVDIKAQPHYPFRFIQSEAIRPPLDLGQFDFIWASPPCQAHVSLRWMYNAKQHADLIPVTRNLLMASGKPYCIENVPGAKTLKTSILLCGSMFGLGAEGAELRRHRHFETSLAMLAPPCQHLKGRVIGVYGGHGRDRRRKVNTQDFSTNARRAAMGIDWMNGTELSQAIPPAYSEFIGRAAMAHLLHIKAQAE